MTELTTSPPAQFPSAQFARSFVRILALCVLAGLPSETFGQAHDETPMELSGYSISEAYDIKDDTALDIENPYIIRLLYRIKKTSPKSRSDYSKFSADVSWEKVNATPEDFRFWVFDRKIRLKKITKHRFEDAAKDSEIKGVFVCHCENENKNPVIVLSRTMPRNLPIETPIDEPVGMTGFLFARTSGMATTETKSSDSAPNNLPVFITDRLAWHPEQITDGRSNYSQTLLANVGVDIGQLDFVRQCNTQSLGDRDSEAFFQMMSGMQKLPRDTKYLNPLTFAELMQNASTNFGNIARIKGVVRSCTEVHIANVDVKKRLGISKFYQLMMFPDLDGGNVVIKNKAGKDIEYKRFPITVCCTELPEGTSAKDIEHKPLIVDGFFFRFWRYQSDMTDAIIEQNQAENGSGGITGQVSPLIIAKIPTQIESQAGKLNLILLAFIGALIIGIFGLFTYFRFADRGRRSPGQEILETLPERIDLAGIEE